LIEVFHSRLKRVNSDHLSCVVAPVFAAHFLLILIVAASILLMLVRPRGVAEVYWIGAGAVLLVVLRLIPLKLAGQAIAAGTSSERWSRSSCRMTPLP